MESEHIDKVAFPLNRLAVATHFQANDVVQRANRGVIAWNPFWVHKCEWTGPHRDGEFGMKETASNIRRIHVERNRQRWCSKCYPPASAEHQQEERSVVPDKIYHFGSEFHLGSRDRTRLA